MRQVLKLPAFRWLLAVSMASQLAVSVGAVALAVLVYRRTGSALGATAFFLCAEFGPAVVAPVFVARFESLPPRRSLGLLNAACAGIFLLLAWLVHRFSLAAVLGLTLLAGSFAVTSGVLIRAAWTSLTSPSGFVREANAVVNTGFSICLMAGPALGGLLVAAGGAVAALLVNAGAYALSSVVIVAMRSLPRPATDPARTLSRIKSAAAYVRREPFLRRLLGLQTGGMLFFAISIPVEVILAQRTLRAGPGGYGALLAAWGAGAILGSAFYARWRGLSSRGLITFGTVLMGIGFLVMAVAPSLPVAIVGAAGGGVGNGIQVVSMRTALQEAVQDRWMALVLSFNQALFQAIPGAGIALGGAIAALAGPRVALAVGAAGSLSVAAAMWVWLAIAVPTRARGPEITHSADSGSDLSVEARRS